MLIAFTFVTPLLLLGLLAAAIPFVLHLLASVRAQDMLFPTLRFLKISMEKTARRRRLQHWLLLVLRAMLLGLLAISVAEPLSRATGAWFGGASASAVVVLDNGYSMAAAGEAGSRLERAKQGAAALLGGDDKPSLAAVLTTSGGFVSRGLSASLEELRSAVARTRTGYGRPALAERVKSAYEMLAGDSGARKAIYVFSDLQRTSFEELAALDPNGLPGCRDVHLLVVDTARGEANNVGIARLDISGRRVVDSVLEFTVEIANSSPTDRTADVALELDGAGVVRRVRKALAAAGQQGSSALVRFHHRFANPGQVRGKVFLEAADDLAADNVRRFCIDIGDRVRALIVSDSTSEPNSPMLAPGAMLLLALEPYDDRNMPWPIRPRTVEAAELGAADLHASDIAFFCDVPRFSDSQARAVETFVAGGGTAAFFLGPAVEAENYNERFRGGAADSALLPARLAAPVGEVGPAARSFRAERVDSDHEYLAGLYARQADYLTVLTQRYWRFAAPVAAARTLIRLAGGDPLVQWKPFGAGRVVVVTTTANPKWTNLPITGLFLPMVARMSLLARHDPRRDAGDVPPGAPATIRPSFAGPERPAPGEKLYLHVTPPPGVHAPAAPLALHETAEGWQAAYADTGEIGLYRWQVARAGGGRTPDGAFVVNPYGPECVLAPMPAKVFQRLMNVKGLARVYVADSLAAAHAAAVQQSEGRNWWDLLAAAAIVVLVFEAVVANRRSREEAVPEHLAVV